MTDLDRTIDHLAADLRPVRRLAPPALRALGWLAAVAALAGGLAAVEDLRGVAARLAMAPDLWLSAAGALLTAVLAALAAFQLSVPGAARAWALLPLPAVLLWLGASGWGCLRGDVLGQPAGTPAECLRFIVLLSVPLSVLLVGLLRRACPLRPGLVAALGGLAAAAAAAALLPLVHPHDPSALDLAAHMAAVGVVVLANRAMSGRVLAAA